MTSYSTKCCQFVASSSQYVTLGNVLDFERNQTFSWSFWMKAASVAADQYLIAKQGGTAPEGWCIYVKSDGYLGVGIVNTATTNNILVWFGNKPCTNHWRHVVVTYDGTSLAAGLSAYFDKQVDNRVITYNNLTSNISNSYDLYFGGRVKSSPGYYTGLLDDIACYNKVLSQSEVDAIYNLGGPGDLSTLSTWSNCLGWWKMGDGDTYPTLTDNKSTNNGTMTGMSASNLVSPTVAGTKTLGGVLYPTKRYYSTAPSLGVASPSRSIYYRGRSCYPSLLMANGTWKKYLKRARDAGSAPPAYTEWVSVDRRSEPPTDAPVGPWTDIKILGEW